MTITFPHQTDDHQSRVAAIAVTLIVAVTAAGLTVWQGSFIGGGDSSAAVATADVEVFSPESARRSQAATVTTARAVASPAVERRQALESSLLGAARVATVDDVRRGNGHPDIRTATNQASSARIPSSQSPPATAQSFAAIEASTELKELALAQSVTDWVVDYETAEEILKTLVQSGEAQSTATERTATNCGYWGNC